MRHVSLSDVPKPTYEAVSYCWGDATKRFFVVVDGYPVNVPASAEYALRGLRHSHNDRVLWIDAVCINQADINERGSQVALMGNIYSMTSRTLIWLGPETRTTAKVVDSLGLIIADMRRQTNGFRDLISMLWNKMGIDLYSQRKPSITIDEAAVLNFYQLPWFQRLWVIQEVALAPSAVCYCGPIAMDLRVVLRAAMWIQHGHLLIDNPMNYRAISCASQMFILADHDLGLESINKIKVTILLSLTRDYVCSDPRDKFFGLIGLLTQHQEGHDLPTLLAPDYSKSIAEVFVDVTLYAIAERQDLDILQQVRHRGTANGIEGGLPSWVPAYHQNYNGQVDPDGLFRGFSACEDCNIQSEISSSRHLLLVQGLSVDKVVLISSKLVYGQGVYSVLETIAAASENWRFASLNTIDAEILAHTLFAGRTDGGPQTAENFDAQLWALLRDDKNECPTTDCTDESGEEEAKIRRYTAALYSALDNRRFFVTSAGRIGLGPQTMQDDDIISVLYGGKWPFVLRHIGGDEYEFIGHCYVHGIMHGEAMRKYKADGAPDQVFHLR